MEKIYTIFDRDWEGNRGVVNKVINELPKGAIATEKVNGTNVRITVRNHILVRLEKRLNPTERQKAMGITEPWYKDADEYNSEDKYIYDAAKNTDLTNVPDGEWSGEAIGPMIQGNELKLEKHTVLLFGLGLAPKFEDAPRTFEELKIWLPKQKSKINPEVGIEGLVWWCSGEPVGKIKLKDFK